MTSSTAADVVDPTTTEGVDYDLKLIENLNLGRWLKIRRQYDLSTEEILADSSLILLVCAHECWSRARRGQQDWPRFEAMSIKQLGALFEVDASKSAGGGEDGDAPDPDAPGEDATSAEGDGDPGVGAGAS